MAASIKNPSTVESAGPGSYVRTFSTLGCPELGLDGVLALARENGIAAVELRVLEGSMELPSVFERNAESAATLMPRLAEAGVRVLALATSMSLIDGSDSDFGKLLEFVPWAEAMGVPWLRVFDGGKSATGAELDRAALVVARWRKLRADRGWKTDLMVETHDALSTSAAIGRLTRAVTGLAILWDSHHTWRNGGEHPAETWATVHGSVVHIHVKDSRLEGGTASRYVLPGTGEFPMESLRRALGGFTGGVSLEWERQWHPELPPLSEALLSARSTSWW
jgi:sugar phosphate isomerase/epimerase